MTEFHVLLGSFLFAIGGIGFLVRRNAIISLMCLELMLNGVNLCLVSFAHAKGNADGSALVLFIVLVAAAEAAVALSLLVALFRKTGSVFLDDYRELRG
ncbi:MAG: NADH-quinone oxidoreductase subunit NuoK [Bdellovibrionales bacterium]|nr:NADH-quinone oxidoreductase subunit NuoK [Bdellovibrionales bacterium]